MIEGVIAVDNEVDVYNINLTAGREYTVAVIGGADNNGLDDPFLGIFSSELPDGFFIENSVELERDPLVTFFAATTETFSFNVTNLVGSDTGEYTFVIAEPGSEILEDLLGGIA
jgi:hypothetical protein